MKYFLDFHLPDELIATMPTAERDGDKMMVFDTQKLFHEKFSNISHFFRSGDVIVFNNSKVFKARLDIFSIKSDTVSELLLIEQKNNNTWLAMIKKARRFKIGDSFKIIDGTIAQVVDILEDGLRKIVFERDFYPEDADKLGHIPLPPYIIDERKKRGEELYTDQDNDRYQTIFAKYYGSVAAPTASLRFSDSIISELKNKGVLFEEVTLHVGIGTFKPMDTDPDNFKIHHEKISISQKTIDRIIAAKKNNSRIIAAGTTVCRVLESIEDKAFDGWTDIFIKPGYQFKMIDGLITNFHLPYSTLLLLVQSFIGIENTEFLYQEALAHKYRFFSYGDGMLLFNSPI